MPEKWLERIDLQRFAPALGLRLEHGHKVRCLSPSHEDKHPSMVVYQDGAHCHACGCHLGVIDTIMAITGKSREDAIELARNEAGAQSVGETKPGLWIVNSLDDIHTIKGKPARLVKSWEYRSATGVVLGGTARFSTPGGKQYFPWRPTADGRVAMKRVSPPLPLFNLDRLRDAERVLVVEGEKVAARAQELFDQEGARDMGLVVTCWMGGSKAVQATDWAPLDNKDVAVWPDNDAPGDVAANDIATIIDGRAKSVRRVKPDPEWKSKVDLYDIIEDFGWDAPRIAAYIEAHHDVGPRPPEPPRENVPSVADNSHFKILGYVFLPKGGCQIVIYEKQTSTVHTISKALSAVDCLQIATSRDFWHNSFCPGRDIDVFGKRVLETIYEVMLRTAKTVGWFDTERLKGRGWHWSANGEAAVLNTGDRLVVAGEDRGLTEMSGQTVWLRKKAIDWGDSSAELPADINRKVWDVFDLQMWDLREQAYAVAGWVTIAPICGLLSFRPGLWLRGDAGMGKSYLGSFIRKLLGPTLRLTHGGSTEAGLRRTLYNDTVAFLIDEQESSNRSESINVEATLKLMRSCSGSEGAEILKADTSTPGGVTEGVLKTIMMFVSVGHQQLNDPNESRIFSALVARPPEMDKLAFSRHALDKIRPAMEFATNGTCPPAAFLLWVRRNVTRILESIRIGRDALVRAYGDFRFADLHGTLLGAGLFLRDNAEPDPDEVCEISDALASRQSASKVSDHIQLIHRLMEHRVQLPQSVTMPAVGGGLPASEEAVARDATLMALIMRASEEEVDGLPVGVEMAQKILAQNGILAGYGRRSNVARDNTRLYLAVDHATMRTALRGTRWEGSDYAAVLSRTIGDKVPNRLRFADRQEYGLHIELSSIPMYKGVGTEAAVRDAVNEAKEGEDDGDNIPF